MRWMWIDNILEYERGERLVAIKNVSLAEEHLHDHFPAEGDLHAQPIMPTSLIIEGMAQSAGILVGAYNDFREKVLLAKVIKAEVTEDVSHGETIRYSATIARMNPQGASTRGEVAVLRHAGPNAGEWKAIGQVDLMFSHLDNNLQGLEFPEENFVFSENFRTLLESAGLGHLAETAVTT
ncbi:MAG: beta-hydroxyacyl-ACP dehydratase [Planctomycetota bacterium]